MQQSKVYMLLEPSVMIPTWYSKSIEGLKESAAKQKKTLQRVECLEEIEEDIPAVILLSTNNEWTLEQVDKCRLRGIRPILIGCSPSKFGEDVSGTMYSGKSSIEGLLNYFVSCGRKRVALLGLNENSSNDIAKRDFFLSFAKKRNLPITADDIYYRVTSTGNYSESFFDAIHCYDGVICSNDYVAAFVLQYAIEHGIKVPEQLFVSGLGDSPLCRYTQPSLTSATRSYRKTGEQAFNIWKQIINDPEIFSIIVTVQCEIKTRGSTAFAPLPPIEETLQFASTKTSLPANTVATEDIAIRSLEHCLSQCDKTDIQIIQGILQGVTVESMAEALFIAPGTVRYRLKKIYDSANVNSRAKFIGLFGRYIRNPIFFQDYLNEFIE